MSNVKPRSDWNTALLTGVCLTATLCSASASARVNVQSAVSADAIYQDVQVPDQNSRSLTTFTVEPSVTATYQSADVSGYVNGNVTYLDRDRDALSQEDTFAEYSYSGQWMPLDRLLILQASGAVNYQNATAGNYLVSDFVSNAQGLAKTRSNRYSATMQLDQGNWVRGAGTLAYATVSSDRAALGTNNRLDNDTYISEGGLRNGENAKRLFWSVNGSYQKTEGDNLQANRGDFISRRGAGNVDLMVFDHWGIRATGTHEANQISNRTDTGSRIRQFETYGAGIVYRQSEARYIAITANRTESDIVEEEEDEFIGGDLRWAFSPRTQLAASYGRRFYGEAADVTFTYNSKHLRASVRYDEAVTNTSRLLADPQNLGVFICPINATGFADCFQPASLDYQPSPDEVAIDVVVPNIEFDDNIILRRSGYAQIGYSFSRLSFGVFTRYSEDDFLDEERIRETVATGITFNYNVGSFTNLSARIEYADIEQRAENFESGTSENWNANVTLTHQFGRRLSSNFRVGYIKKDGDLAQGSAFGPNYNERRISVGVTYQFD